MNYMGYAAAQLQGGSIDWFGVFLASMFLLAIPVVLSIVGAIIKTIFMGVFKR